MQVRPWLRYVCFRMWLIPVGTLLQCEHMPSHQEALAKGMLVQYTSEIAGRVIFGQCAM